MDESGTIYITIGLLYNLGGTLFLGIALASFWSEEELVTSHDNATVNTNDLVVKSRRFADSMVGLLMLFFGFALQALGHNVVTANSLITFLLVISLLFLMIAHSVYIREILAEECAEEKVHAVKQSLKNKAYFGQA